MTAADTVH